MPEFGYVWSFVICDYAKAIKAVNDADDYVLVDRSPTFRVVCNNSSMAFHLEINRTGQKSEAKNNAAFYSLWLYWPSERAENPMSYSYEMTLGNETMQRPRCQEYDFPFVWTCLRIKDDDEDSAVAKKLDEWCRTKIGEKLTISIRITIDDDRFDMLKLFDSDPMRSIVPAIIDRNHPTFVRMVHIRDNTGNSDFTLAADDGELAVHKNLLASSNEYFADIFAGGKFELDENKKGRLVIANCKRALLKIVIDYMYLGYLDLIDDILTLDDYDTLLRLTKLCKLEVEVVNSIELSLIKSAIKALKSNDCTKLAKYLDFAMKNMMKILEDVATSSLSEVLNKTEQEMPQLTIDQHRHLLKFIVERDRGRRY